MRRSDGKGKSERRPFRDISNRRIVSSKSTKKIKPGPEKDERSGSGDTMDRLLLVHSDISNVFRQIDELVVQVVKAEETDRQGRKEIESFTLVLSDLFSSLKPWVPKLQKATSVQKQPSKMECIDNLAVQSPEPSKMECLVSPSPLVSWRATECTVEMGKQLFALTPLPRPKTEASKGQSLSKSVALQRFNSSAAVFPSCFSNAENAANEKKQTSEDSPAHVAKKMNMNLPKFLKRDSSFVLTTPCLKMSPVRSCKLLEPNSGFSNRNFDKVYKSTPFPLGKQLLSELLEDESSGSEASQDMGLKYSSSILNPVFSIGNGKKASDASPAWCMSPPKTCVLMDPSDDNPLKDDLLGDKPFKEDEFEELSGAFKQHMTLVSCGRRLPNPIVESTPMWKEPQSTAYKGRRPGENTLKKELWVRFEAATTNDGLNLNLAFPKAQNHKGFLDMLEEAS